MGVVIALLTALIAAVALGICIEILVASSNSVGVTLTGDRGPTGAGGVVGDVGPTGSSSTGGPKLAASMSVWTTEIPTIFTTNGVTEIAFGMNYSQPSRFAFFNVPSPPFTTIVDDSNFTLTYDQPASVTVAQSVIVVMSASLFFINQGPTIPYPFVALQAIMQQDTGIVPRKLGVQVFGLVQDDNTNLGQTMTNIECSFATDLTPGAHTYSFFPHFWSDPFSTQTPPGFTVLVYAINTSLTFI